MVKQIPTTGYFWEGWGCSTPHPFPFWNKLLPKDIEEYLDNDELHELGPF